ncbi:MAG TPA: YicC/YloC family endoribonuclease [Gammaproteobacteria bacterium]
MIRSMTAFARQESQDVWGSLVIELRSVNHRYLETTLRMPEELRSLEPQLRDRISQTLNRGKVECNLRYQPPAEIPGEIAINRELVARIAHASREIDAILYNPAPINALELLRWPGVLQLPVADPEQLKAAAVALLDAALQEMTAVREREGEKLRNIILQRCDAMAGVIAGVQERLPQVMNALRERLRQRLAELQVEAEPGRLEQEMVIQTQRLDVDEEVDRLKTHLAEVRRILNQDQPAGRRLDFLMQELNREANTLGSKSADAETTRASVDLKVLIEQMREQIQNIE